MTNSLSPVDVCNMALSQIAARASITSISPSDGTVAGDACALLISRRSMPLRAPRIGTATASTAALSLLEAAAATPQRRDNPAGPAAAVALRVCAAARLPQGTLHRSLADPAGHSPPLTTGTSTFLPARLGAMAVPFTPAVDLDFEPVTRSRSSSPTSAPRSPDRRRSSTPAAWSTSGCGMRNFSWEQKPPSPTGWSIR